MQITVQQGISDLVVIPMEKRIDAHVAGAFRTSLLAQVDAGHRNIVVDLEHVEFIDSSGLGALVSVLKRIGRDGNLSVRSLTGGVRSMFELTRLNRVIPILEPAACAFDAGARR